MAVEHPLGDISGLKQSDTDIRHIFSRYIKTLFDTKWRISDEMTEWSKKLINQIQEYVTQQKELLEQVYAKKVIYLNTLRDQVLEQALKYEETKDTEQINQLINQCNNFRVELAMLAYIERPIQSIQLITDVQLQQEPQPDNQCTVQKAEEIPTENNNQEMNGDSPTNENPPTEPPPPPSTNSPTKSIVEEDQLITNYEMTITRRDDLADKCPICYMIFPQSMTVFNRNSHVNEHYNDE